MAYLINLTNGTKSYNVIASNQSIYVRKAGEIQELLYVDVVPKESLSMVRFKERKKVDVNDLTQGNLIIASNGSPYVLEGSISVFMELPEETDITDLL